MSGLRIFDRVMTIGEVGPRGLTDLVVKNSSWLFSKLASRLSVLPAHMSYVCERSGLISILLLRLAWRLERRRHGSTIASL